MPESEARASSRTATGSALTNDTTHRLTDKPCPWLKNASVCTTTLTLGAVTEVTWTAISKVVQSSTMNLNRPLQGTAVITEGRRRNVADITPISLTFNVFNCTKFALIDSRAVSGAWNSQVEVCDCWLQTPASLLQLPERSSA